MMNYVEELKALREQENKLEMLINKKKQQLVKIKTKIEKLETGKKVSEMNEIEEFCKNEDITVEEFLNRIKKSKINEG